MRGIVAFFQNGLLCNLRIPGYIQGEFLRETVRKNDFSLRVICAIIFAVEAFNIVRVLFLSQSGLSTRNNQIYFAMYCALIAVAVLWLVLQRPMQRAGVGRRWAVQYAVAILLFLWHIGLNTYDLYRDPNAGITVLTTAVLGLAMFIQMPPWCSVTLFGMGYLLFWAVMAPLLDGGGRINLTITFTVALMVSLAHVHHTTVTLNQQKQILQMNAKLQDLVQMEPLTGLLNKTTVECRTEQLLRDLQHTERHGGLTLFLLDLDDFKAINDRCGHPCGDHVLVETARSMRDVFADAVGLGRVGGDEFAVLYDRPMTAKRAVDLSRGLMERLGDLQWQNQPLKVGCSVGVCVCTLSHCSYALLYAETDRMLYQAKKSGRGRCCVQYLETEKTSESSGHGKDNAEPEPLSFGDARAEHECVLNH